MIESHFIFTRFFWHVILVYLEQDSGAIPGVLAA